MEALERCHHNYAWLCTEQCNISKSSCDAPARLVTGTARNGFGRLRSISTPEGARAHGVPIPPQGGSPVRRPGGLPNVPSSEHDSERELVLLRRSAPRLPASI